MSKRVLRSCSSGIGVIGVLLGRKDAWHLRQDHSCTTLPSTPGKRWQMSGERPDLSLQQGAEVGRFVCRSRLYDAGYDTKVLEASVGSAQMLD